MKLNLTTLMSKINEEEENLNNLMSNIRLHIFSTSIKELDGSETILEDYKSDLTEAKVTKDWINELSSETVKVLEVNCLKGQGLQQIKPALLELLKEKHERAKAKGLVKFMM